MTKKPTNDPRQTFDTWSRTHRQRARLLNVAELEWPGATETCIAAIGILVEHEGLRRGIALFDEAVLIALRARQRAHRVSYKRQDYTDSLTIQAFIDSLVTSLATEMKGRRTGGTVPGRVDMLVRMVQPRHVPVLKDWIYGCGVPAEAIEEPLDA